MMNREANGLLGLIQRSRRMVSGAEVIKGIQKRQVYLVVIAQECGENTRKKLMDKCTSYEVPYVFMEGEAMNRAIGTQNRMAVAITDKGFAQKLHACWKG